MKSTFLCIIFDDINLIYTKITSRMLAYRVRNFALVQTGEIENIFHRQQTYCKANKKEKKNPQGRSPNPECIKERRVVVKKNGKYTSKGFRTRKKKKEKKKGGKSKRKGRDR